MVTNRDETLQVELIARFHAEGLDCRALLSPAGIATRSAVMVSNSARGSGGVKCRGNEA
jgi:hypothetical protein